MGKKILLLDEATSALGSQSKGLVQEALQEAGSNKAIISITHASFSLGCVFYVDGE